MHVTHLQSKAHEPKPCLPVPSCELTSSLPRLHADSYMRYQEWRHAYEVDANVGSTNADAPAGGD